MPTRDIHVAVLGTGGVGKSSMTAQFVQNVWIDSYDPTIEDYYRKHIEVDGHHVYLEILDTAGTEQFTAMRELYIKSSQGFVLVFSITSMSSLRELNEIHDQLARIKNDANVPLILVGNKADLADNRAVSEAKANTLAQSWGKPYYETSAKKRTNVDEVFMDLCRQIMHKMNEDTAKATAGSKIQISSDARQGQKTDTRKRRRRGNGTGCTIL